MHTRFAPLCNFPPVKRLFPEKREMQANTKEDSAYLDAEREKNESIELWKAFKVANLALHYYSAVETVRKQQLQSMLRMSL